MLIYKNEIHSLLNKNNYVGETCSFLVRNTLEMVTSYPEGKLLYVEGYLPLHQARLEHINIPVSKKTDYFFSSRLLYEMEPHLIVRLDRIIPDYEEYYSFHNLGYDEVTGIIKVGIASDKHWNITINRNLTVTVDNEQLIRCMYIKPDMFL